MFNLKIIKDYAVKNGIHYLENEMMRNHTTFKIGGPADLVVFPSNEVDLNQIFYLCNENRIKLYIVGNGSNLLVGDKGIRGVVIKTEKLLGLKMIEENVIEAYAGELLSKTANFALENNLSGFEFASGIPGTVGGGVYMNAGAYGMQISDVVIKTVYIDNNGNNKVCSEKEHCFDYRHSIFKDNDNIILKTYIKLKSGDHDYIKEKMADYNNLRKIKQPLEYPSAGSIFKRPKDHFAGKLIEDSGLINLRVGGAVVSKKHAGFIVNDGNATCKDVLELIEKIKSKVYKKFGVELETEVKYIGE